MKPPLKWVGGKSRLLPKILNLVPGYFEDQANYFEAFLGAGSVFLGISKIRKAKKWILSDLNADLITLWKSLQTQFTEFTSICQNIENSYNCQANMEGKESYYFAKRIELKNSSGVQKSAIFAFLNKAAFNGLVRYNKNGEFNAAFGKREKINFDFCNWKTIHQHLNTINVEFLQEDFADALTRCEKSDFVYLDPPYLSIGKRQIDKRAYNSGGFDLHENLVRVLYLLDSKKVKWLLSNHVNDWLIKSLPSPPFHHYQVECRKIFSGKVESRQNTSELLIKNY